MCITILFTGAVLAIWGVIVAYAAFFHSHDDAEFLALAFAALLFIVGGILIFVFAVQHVC